jgi:hypothetical protein
MASRETGTGLIFRMGLETGSLEMGSGLGAAPPDFPLRVVIAGVAGVPAPEPDRSELVEI